MSKPLPFLALATATALLASSQAHAVVFGGIEFPAGAASFADTVISYDPNFSNESVPSDPDFIVPSKSLGSPDFNGNTGAVALGSGGRLILEFTDNFLTGSNSAVTDLHIFEVGPDIEDTFVDISKDGIVWFSLGKITGSTSSIDIDAFGFNASDLFTFVRLTDDKDLDQQSGSTVGADIDAVGAITTIPRTSSVPDTGSTLLLATFALAGMIGLRRKFGN